MKFMTIVFFVLLILGCSMPNTSVRSVDSRPSIIIKGTSENAALFVDGLNMGKAIIYNGNPKALNVLPGTHKITIIENDKIIYEKTVFVDSEMKVITVY
ncbi:hypothetical protein JCM30471_29680 [Desulfuromonas carbonis]